MTVIPDAESQFWEETHLVESHGGVRQPRFTECYHLMPAAQDVEGGIVLQYPRSVRQSTKGLVMSLGERNKSSQRVFLAGIMDAMQQRACMKNACLQVTSYPGDKVPPKHAI